MRARDLRRLAEVSAAAKMDLESGTATLHGENNRVRGWYQSPYAACGIVVASGETFSVSVGAQEFKAISELFDEDDDLTVIPTDSALVVASKRRKMSLRFEGYPDPEAYELLVKDFSALFDVDAAEFVREVRTAVQFCAIQMSQPILTGIRLRARGGLLALEAMNGSSLISQVTLKISSYEGDISVVVPSTNIQDALGAMRSEGRLHIGMKGKALVLRGTDAVFKIPTLGGEWPKYASTLKNLSFPDTVRLSVDTVRALAGAVKIYKAPADIQFLPGDGCVLLETKEVEAGHFVEEIEGEVSRPYTFDVSDLEVVSRTIADAMVLEIGETMGRVSNGTRNTFIMQRTVYNA